VKLKFYRFLEVLFGLLGVACICGIWYNARRYGPWVATPDGSLTPEQLAQQRGYLCTWGVGLFAVLTILMAFLVSFEKCRLLRDRKQRTLSCE
jgi:hypothetical protein